MKVSMQKQLVDFVQQLRDGKVYQYKLKPVQSFGGLTWTYRKIIVKDSRNPLLVKLEQSCSLFTSFWKLSDSYFDVNGIEKPNDPALFFNRKLTNLATSFMKRIQQDLIAICWHLNIELFGTTATLAYAFMEYKSQDSNFFISQSSNLVTIKCSDRNIFVTIDALKRSEYFRMSLDMHYIIYNLLSYRNSP